MGIAEILSIVITVVTDKDFQEKAIQAAFAIMVTAQGIVNLTSTPKDDAFVGKAYRVVEAIAGLWTSKAKQKPGEQ